MLPLKSLLVVESVDILAIVHHSLAKTPELKKEIELIASMQVRLV